MKDEVERIVSEQLKYVCPHVPPDRVDECELCKSRINQTTTQLIDLFAIDEKKLAYQLGLEMSRYKCFEIIGIQRIRNAVAKTIATKNIYKGVKK